MRDAEQLNQDHRDHDHVDNGLLIRFLDGELPEGEFNRTRSHLAVCEICRQKRDGFARLSSELEGMVDALHAQAPIEARAMLAHALVAEDSREGGGHNSGKIMRRFGWGMALAASLAIGILLAPRMQLGGGEKSRTAAPRSTVASLDVNGERFIALPYSNPDLPVSAVRIVEMQVPVSSLASAGIVLEPGAGGMAERTVPANVLLGIDGQPLGLHLLSTE